ncbi:MAG: hypothetical protein U0N82_12005 [Oscillospiraceae bacterium]
MTDREKLVDLLWQCVDIDTPFGEIADFLIANGVSFTPAVPGPSEDDPNIMELCFHNGERHMKEKVGKELTRLAEHMPCITMAQALAMLEGL